MSAVSELKTAISIRDNVSAGLKAIQKEQLHIKKEVQEAKEVLKNTFGKKWSIKLQSIELLRHIREAAIEIGLLRKQLGKVLQGLKTSKLNIENKTAIYRIKLVAVSFSTNNMMPDENKAAKAAEKAENGSPIDNIIKYVLDKDSLKEAKTNIKNFSKAAIRIPVSAITSPIKKAFSIIKTFAKTALAISIIAIFKKSAFLKKLPQRVFRISFLVEVSKTLRKLKPVFNILSRFSKIGMDIRPKLNGLKDMRGKMANGLKTAGGAVLRFAKTGLLALGQIAAKGISEAVESGAILEKQNLYMDQAIAANSSNMGGEEVKKQRDGYMKQLRDSAAETGMDSGDVISAGTKAVGITGGDTKEAMELVKVAQDMAAMNPGKSVAEAMEALAAAKSGKAEALKDFNANVSQQELDKIGFKGVVQQKLKPKFAGGAEKSAGTGAGLVSVIKGKLNNKLQDMGLGIIEKLKPALESVVMLIDRYSPALDAFGGGIASGIGLAINSIQTVAEFIGEKFAWIGEKTGFLKEVFMTSWEGIKSEIAVVWEFLQPVIDLIANDVMLLFNIFQWVFPGIKMVIETVWSIIKPIFENLGGAIGWVADKVGALAEWFDKKKDNSGGGAGAFAGIDEVSPKNKQTFTTSNVGVLQTQAMANTGFIKETALPSNENYKSGSMPKTYVVPQTSHSDSGKVVQNPQFTININGINKSTNEIISEMIPKLKLALTNMSPGKPGKERYGGALA